MLKNQPNGKFGYGFKQIRKGSVRDDSTFGDMHSYICPSNFAGQKSVKSPNASVRNSVRDLSREREAQRRESQ